MTVSDITVCIATFGDEESWSPLVKRAWRSAADQTLSPKDVVYVHGDDLHVARNAAAADVFDGWLCFLDADDELDPGYLEAMQRTIDGLDSSRRWLLQPATLGVYPGGATDSAAVVIPRKPLIDGNYMVIGTLISADQFHRVGAFRPWACYEDWDLWIRAWLDGAESQAVPEAIYRVHVSPGSRNNGDRRTQVATYHAIRNQHLAASRRRGSGADHHAARHY